MENAASPDTDAALQAILETNLDEARRLIAAADPDIRPWAELILIGLLSRFSTDTASVREVFLEAGALPAAMQTAIAEFARLRNVPDEHRRRTFLDALCAAHPILSACAETLIWERQIPLVTKLQPLCLDENPV